MLVNTLKKVAFIMTLAVLPLIAACQYQYTSDRNEIAQSSPIWQASEQSSWHLNEVENWESAIAAFVEEDKNNPPKPDSIVFVGSSSIVFWKTLHEDMAPLSVVQRGFGGSKIYHSLFYADKIIWPYKPKAIVMFAGSNDILGPDPKGPDIVEQGFIDFVAKTRERFPDIDIHWISISPSNARYSALSQVLEANERVKKLAARDPNLFYIDTASHLLKKGEPNDDLFIHDKLHLNEEGYALWTSIIKPNLITLYGETQY